MSNSTTLLDTIQTNQSNKEALANALFDAASPAMIYGRHASACSGLVWGYYGGQFLTNAIANGTLTLTASATNYVQANPTTGAVTTNTTGFTTGYIQLYTIVTGASTVTSYTDLRQSGIGGGSGGGGSGTVTDIAATGGVETNQTSGADITTTGTIRGNMLLAGGTVQTSAYTFVTGDRGKCLVMNDASPSTQVLPTPTTGPTSNFPAGWYGWCDNIGAGTMTLEPPSGLELDGVTNGTLAIPKNGGCGFFTDGTNWYTVRGIAGSGGGGSTTLAGLTDVNVTEGTGIDGFGLSYSYSMGQWQAIPSRVGPGTNGQLDPAHASPYGTVSNNGQTWTGNTGIVTQWQAVRSLGIQTAGKYYAEATVTNLADGIGFGICNAAASLAVNIPTGSDTNGLGFLYNETTPNAGAYYNSGFISGSSTTSYPVTGSVLAIAVDLTLNKVWIYNPANSKWNNDVIGNQNPATGTGGYPISAITSSGGIYLAADVLGPAASLTINPGYSAFTYTIPSGFVPWVNGNVGTIKDVSVTNPVNGQVLQYNASTAKFVNTLLTYSGLSDVALLNAPTAGQVPVYGTKWANQTPVLTPIAAATMDPSHKSANLTLSNSNLTGTSTTSSSSWEPARGTVGKTSGKWYAELTINTIAGAFGFGVCNAAESMASGYIVGTDTNGIIMYNHPTSSTDGVYYNSGALLSNLGTPLPTTGTTVGMAVDMTLNKVWFYNPGPGTWNNDVIANQNPATGTGGFSISAINTGTIYPAFNALGSGSVAGQVTFNGGSSQFANAVPAGFSPWTVPAASLLADVAISSPTNGQVLTYSSSTGQWTNQTPSAGGLTAPTIVQQANNANSSDAVVVTLGSTPTPGNLLVAIVGGYPDTNQHGYNASGNGWSQVASLATFNGNENIAVLIKPVLSGDPAAYTFTAFDTTNAADTTAIVYEITNAGQVQVVSSLLPALSSSTGSAVLPGMSAASASSLALFGVEQDAGAAYIASITSGWTIDMGGSAGSLSYHMTAAGHMAISAGGPFAPPTATWSGANTSQQMPAVMVLVSPVL